MLLVGGCGSSLTGGPSTPAATSQTPTGSDDQLFDRRARQVATAWNESGLLKRWDASFVPASPLVLEPDWTPRGALKAAFAGGWVRATVALPDVGGRSTLVYADGSRSSVTTIGAQAAYDAMVNPRSGDCPAAEDGSTDCDWVTVTGARATMVPMQTARGTASVPAWAFTVQGLAEPLVRVSVEGAAEPGDFEPSIGPAPADGRRLLLAGQDITAQNDRQLTVTLGSGDCDTAITAHILETDRVVVVGGTATGPAPDQMCNAMLRLQEVVLPLAEPAGIRPVLDAVSGRPLLPRRVPRR